MIAAGVLILLFVAYQLWGTGIRTARAQDRLEDELRAELLDDAADDDHGAEPADDDHRDRGRTPTPTITGDGRPPARPGRPSGEAVGRIEIPTIGVD